MLVPLKERDFARLWAGQMVSNAGDWVNYVALTAMVIGPALGGIILAAGGTSAAFYFDSATFVFSAVAIASMSVSGASRREVDRTSSAWKELSEGLRFASSWRSVRTALMLEMGMMLGWGSIKVLAVVIAEKLLGGGTTEYGVLLTAVGLGSLAGALLAGNQGDRLGLQRFFPLGFLMTGLAIVGLAGSRVLQAASVGCFFAEVGRMAVEVAATTIYQRAVPDGLRGRIFSLRHMVTHPVVLVANQLAGFFTDAASIASILVAAAALQLACGLLSLMLWAGSRHDIAREVD